MYKRSIKPLRDFINSTPPQGVYYIDTQFGTLSYLKDISGTISTRTGASGSVFIIEVKDEANEACIRTRQEQAW